MLSVVIALFLPVLNVHVDEYVPLIQALIVDPNWKTLQFWWIAGLYVGIYSGVVFAALTILSLLVRLVARMLSRRGARA